MIILASKFFLINNIVALVFFVIYAYQVFFIPVSIFRKQVVYPDADPLKYAILICARNEENVIGLLIDSIRDQNYPGELIDIFVIADNCSEGDRTAELARSKGAHVVERYNDEFIGKGYALNYLIDSITENGARWEYDGYFIIDSDNLLDKNFIHEMNKAIAAGNRVATCYRNSKNYGDNWLSAAYALWFLRESRYLNNSRQILGGCAQCSGTGFVIHRDLLREIRGWQYFTLTEDVEFTFAMAARNEKIAYCHNAILYDEQPVKFGESWRQRIRWVKGYFQAYWKHGWSLFKGFLGGRLICYDMLANTFMGAIITVGLFVFYIVMVIIFAVLRYDVSEVLLCFALYMAFGYLGVFVIGAITTCTEWGRIHCKKWKKIKYCFTFPFFLFTLLPIAIWAIFSKSKWPHIKHVRAIGVDDVIGSHKETQ